MTTKEFFHKILSGPLWLNLVAMMAVGAAFVVLLALFTDIYTRHGENIEVPGIVNHNYADAEHVCEEMGLTLEITDSLYNPKLPEGYIVEQLPLAGAEVKAGRVVYVKVNTLTVPTLMVPDIVDNRSSREAVALLRTRGFKLGEVEYVAGEKDWVVGLKCNGRQLKFGDKVKINDVVILQVGNGSALDADDIEYVDPEFLESRAREEETLEVPAGGGEEDDFEVVE